MKRRDFLKVALGATATSLCPMIGQSGTAGIPIKSGQPAPGARAKVFLAGVRKGAPEEAVKLAVRDAVEAATDFSWLSKGDAVFIKPVNNSGNPYPATTSPTAIASMVQILKEKGARRVIVGDMSGVQCRFGEGWIYRFEQLGSQARQSRGHRLAWWMGTGHGLRNLVQKQHQHHL